jgi:hypothetical protein
MATSPSEFDLKVSDCIDQGLGALGEAARKTVYWFLDAKVHLKKETIANEPGKFMATLERLFGQGAGLLEKRIIKELEQTFHLMLGGESLVETIALIRAKRESSASLNPSRRKPDIPPTP